MILALLVLGCRVQRSHGPKIPIQPLVKVAERSEFGPFGTLSGMMGPSFAEGSLFLPDYEQSRILKTDIALNPLLQIGEAGEGPGELAWAGYTSIAQGRLFVDSPFARRLAVYDTTGSFLQWIPTPPGNPLLTRFAVFHELLFLSSAAFEQPITAYDFDGQVLYRMGEQKFTAHFQEQRARNEYHLAVGDHAEQPFLVAVGWTEPVIDIFSLDGQRLQRLSLAAQPLLQPRIQAAEDARTADPESRRTSFTLIRDISLVNNILTCLVTSTNAPHHFLRFEVSPSDIKELDTFRLDGPYQVQTFTADSSGHLYIFDQINHGMVQLRTETL